LKETAEGVPRSSACRGVRAFALVATLIPLATTGLSGHPESEVALWFNITKAWLAYHEDFLGNETLPNEEEQASPRRRSYKRGEVEGQFDLAPIKVAPSAPDLDSGALTVRVMSGAEHRIPE
jgi:hypothetical protein